MGTSSLASPVSLNSITLLERQVDEIHRYLKEEVCDPTNDDLKTPQILLLARTPEEGCNASAFVGQGYYMGTNVSYNLKILLEKGYIMVTPSRMDKRKQVITLTEKGLSIKRGVQLALEKLNKKLSGLIG